MLQAALRAGTASRRSVFEVFTRRLPHGRRYGVFAGVGRVLEGLEQFRFTDEQLRFLRDTGVVDAATVDPVAHLVTEQIVSLLQESFTQRGVTGMIWAGVVALAGVIGAVVRVRTVTYDSGHVHRG